MCLVLLINYANAETLSSPNFNLENPQLDNGGEESSSPNYTSRDAIGGDADSAGSSNYTGYWGFFYNHIREFQELRH